MEMTAPRPVTAEELLLDHPDRPCELVEGRIVLMSPTNWKHGILVTEIASRLRAFAGSSGRGVALSGEVGVYTRRDPDTVRGADAAFISHARLAQAPEGGFLDVAPELVVEVLSPANTKQEIRQKLREYFALGTDRVWVVNPKRKTVIVYTAPEEATVLGEGDVLEGDGLLDGLRLAVSYLFA